MENQIIKPIKKTSAATIAVTLIDVFSALMLTVAWFLPVVSFGPLSVSYLDAISLSGDDGEMAVIYWAFIIISAVSILWAAFPKLWAAIVGIIYSFAPIIICLSQVLLWAAEGISLGIGAIFMSLFSVLILVLSIVKLVLTILDMSRVRTYNAAIQPPPMGMY
ncbi:MAG: hypothetical protein J1E39_07060 [Eubacterium sp.]|nr:hypothetical protein [Eubacterium sp.]